MLHTVYTMEALTVHLLCLSQAGTPLDSHRMELHAGFLGSGWSRDMTGSLGPMTNAYHSSEVWVTSEVLRLNRIS